MLRCLNNHRIGNLICFSEGDAAARAQTSSSCSSPKPAYLFRISPESTAPLSCQSWSRSSGTWFFSGASAWSWSLPLFAWALALSTDSPTCHLLSFWLWEHHSHPDLIEIHLCRIVKGLSSSRRASSFLSALTNHSLPSVTFSNLQFCCTKLYTAAFYFVAGRCACVGGATFYGFGAHLNPHTH